MFVEVNSDVSVNDLLHGIIVQSGNDAAIVVAEGLAGTEEAFAEMTAEARKIGMTKSVFKNATGWPDESHLVTVHDLAILARDTIRNFPSFISSMPSRNSRTTAFASQTGIRFWAPVPAWMA